MEEEKKKRRRWRDIPLATKMILAVGSIMVMMLVINMILYEQVNKTIRRMDTVYSSNVDLTDLSASLENVHVSHFKAGKNEEKELLNHSMWRTVPGKLYVQ